MQAARFISPKKSRELIGKVTGLTSPHQGESLRRSLFVDGKTVSEVFPFKTIVLERYLLRPEETAHRRFTLGHEAGHIVAMRISPDSAACFHHSYDGQREYTAAELRERYTIGEWQANTISASLLMPVPIWKRFCWKREGAVPAAPGSDSFPSFFAR